MSEPYQAYLLMPSGLGPRDAVQTVHDVFTSLDGVIDEDSLLILSDVDDEEPEPEYVQDAAQALRRLIAWPTMGSIDYMYGGGMTTVTYKMQDGKVVAIKISIIPTTYRRSEESGENYRNLVRTLDNALCPTRTIMQWGLDYSGFKWDEELKRLRTGRFQESYKILDIRRKNCLSKYSLWSSPERTRHFLIPNSAVLPSGDFVLRSLTGAEKRVDMNTVAPYEVSREEAKEWVKGQLAGVLHQAKGALLDALRPLEEPRARPQPRRPTKTSKRPEEQKTAEPQTGPSPGLQLLEALSGEPLERLRSDPEAVVRGLKHVIGELGSIAEDSIATDPARLETARQRVKALRLILNAHGLPVSAGADTIPDRLHAFYRPTDADAERAAVALKALADSLEDAATKAAKRLRDLAAELKSRAAATPEGGHAGNTGQASERKPDEA